MHTTFISELKEAEENLRDREEKYRILFQNMAQGAMFRRADGQVEEVNSAALEMFGVSFEEFVKLTSPEASQWKVIHEDGSDFSLGEWPAQIAFTTGKPVRNVTVGIRLPQKQEYLWVIVTAIPQFKTGEKRPYRVFTTFHDVTELKRVEQELRSHQEDLEKLVDEQTLELQREIEARKRSEHSLRESEEKYRLIAENASDVIATQNRAREFTYFSPSIQELLGYSPEEMMQGKHGPLLTPESLKIVADAIAQKRADDPAPTRLELEHIRKDGSTLWLEVIVKRLYDAMGNHSGFLGISRDISERKQAEAALAWERDLLHTLMNSSPDYLFLKDRESRFLRTNTAHAQELLGLPGPEEAVGKTDFDVFPQEEAQRFFGEEQRIMETGQPVVAREWSLTSSTTGKLIWLSEHKVPIHDAAGNVVGLVGISRDVTAQKQAETALQQVKDAALEAKERAEIAQRNSEAANRAKSMFLSRMSHELRTPLNAILGFAQLLARDTTLSSEQREYLSTINRSGDHLLQLINDVLDMSKIESGRVSVIHSSFDLWQMLANIEEMMRVRTDQKGLEFSIEHSADIPRYVISDEKKLRQILINILGNAVKFTEEGCVTLRILDMKSESTDVKDISNSPISHLKFEIIDTGPGIAPKDLSSIFKSFYQSSHEIDHEGTGLGLAISHKFAQLLGGDIQVESDVGRGSRFSVEIRVELADHDCVASDTPMRMIVGLASSQRSIRILIVDDHAASRRLLAALLGNVGFEINEASNGREALILLERWNPDLILMDMRMPVMNGYEATREIRKRGSSTLTVEIVDLWSAKALLSLSKQSFDTPFP